MTESQGDAVELLLWRWSAFTQTISVLLIASFFMALNRSLRLPELRIWTWAWSSNLLALLLTTAFWLLHPLAGALLLFTLALYFLSKSLFVALTVLAAMSMVDADNAARRIRKLPAVATALGLLGVLLAVTSFDAIGIGQSLLIGIAFLVCALYLHRLGAPGSGWLAVGLGIRALLGFAESATYLIDWLGNERVFGYPIANLLAVHSSLDATAEWGIALAALLALHASIERNSSRINDDLKHIQEQLREQVKRDILTGCFNRRALPEILRLAQGNGGSILFFDIDHFKRINDELGHHVGDRCLIRFASALHRCFTPDDHIIRYAGDEFVVVAHAMSDTDYTHCIESLRLRLAKSSADGPPLDFSVGRIHLAANSDTEQLMRAADQAMYADKTARKRAVQ